VLPPPPATPRTLIFKLEPTSRAFLVGGTFSRKHHITGILCCNQTGNAVHPPRRTARRGERARRPALSERYRKRAPSSYTSRTQ
jgi:hypothetical protein